MEENKIPSSASEQKPPVTEQATTCGNSAEQIRTNLDVTSFNVTLASNFYDNDPTQVTVAQMGDIVKNDKNLERLTNECRRYKAICNDPSQSGASVRTAKTQYGKLKQQHPIVIASATCVKGKNRDSIVGLTPVLGLDFDKLTSVRMAEVIDSLKQDNSVCLVSTSISGTGVRAFVVIENIAEVQALWDAAETDAAKSKVFQYMWKQAADHFETLTGENLDDKCAKPEQGYSLAYDADAYYNPVVTPLRIDMSGFEMPKRGRKKTVKNRVGAKTYAANIGDVIVQALKAFDKEGVAFADGGRNDYVFRLSCLLNQYGVDAEEAENWCVENLCEPDFGEQEIHAAVVSAYKHAEEHGTKRSKGNDVEEIMSLMKDVAEFRYNTMTERTEIKYFSNALGLDEKYCNKWSPMTDRDGNTLFAHVLRSVKVSRQVMDSIINSITFAPEFHPLRAYIDECEAWDPSQPNYIDAYFDNIILADESKRSVFVHFWHLWFKRMVVLGLGKIDDNQLAIALVGKENIGKTYLIKCILPPEIRSYYQRIDPCDPIDKDTTISVAEKLVVNFDERVISRRESNTFKSIISGGMKSVRRPYARHPEILAQRASFAFTNNSLQYIGAEAGDRRYLTVHMIGSRSLLEHPVNYQGMYAQAIYEIEHDGVKTDLTKKEVADLKAINEQHIETDPCRDAILTYFRVPKECDASPKWMTATEIFNKVSYGQDRTEVNPTSVGRMMSELGFLKKKYNSCIHYKVFELDRTVVSKSDYSDNDIPMDDTTNESTPF